jgi:O-acetyl-ADP-ribose deacetylase (regulator of RNase III)
VFFYHQKFGWKTGSVVNNAIPPLGIDVDASMVPNEALNNCISMFQGDITTLNVDAIQNAANNQLFSGGGICGAIYNAACEFDLSREVQRKYPNGCDVGQTAISSGCHLHAKHVLHTVGPRGEQPELLESAYRSTLDMAKAHGCKSVALCCISTGIFGYPPEAAAPIAIRTVKKWLEERQKEMAMSGENGGPSVYKFAPFPHARLSCTHHGPLSHLINYTHIGYPITFDTTFNLCTLYHTKVVF